MCNSICRFFKVVKNPTLSMFEIGFVRCNNCDVFLKPEDCLKNKGGSKICPCCRKQVRTSPRCKKYQIRITN